MVLRVIFIKSETLWGFKATPCFVTFVIVHFQLTFKNYVLSMTHFVLLWGGSPKHSIHRLRWHIVNLLCPSSQKVCPPLVQSRCGRATQLCSAAGSCFFCFFYSVCSIIRCSIGPLKFEEFHCSFTTALGRCIDCYLINRSREGDHLSQHAKVMTVTYEITLSIKWKRRIHWDLERGTNSGAHICHLGMCPSGVKGQNPGAMMRLVNDTRQPRRTAAVMCKYLNTMNFKRTSLCLQEA